MSSSALRNRLRGAYGRGVARVPVKVPRSGLEMVPLRPSREIVAAISPLYIAAAIPLSLLFLLSVLVVYTEAPTPGAVVVAEFEPLPGSVEPEEVAAAKPEPLPSPIEKTAPEPAPEAIASAPSPPPSARPIEIEIDAVDPFSKPLPSRAPATRVAAVRVPERKNGLAANDMTVEAGDSFDLVRAATTELPRSNASLPAVSMAGPVERPDVEVGEAGAPSHFGASLEPAAAPAVAALPEAGESERGGLGFTPVARESSGGGGGGGAIAGVPLEALAPCESLAREDELKQTLLRAVRAGTQCEGRDGHYRFIETRNVNAFSMGVLERDARTLGNRCEELERAISCVETQRNWHDGRVEP